MTQEELGHKAGLTTGGYAKVERAQTAPAWGTVRQIAAALDLTIGQLGVEVDRETTSKRRSAKPRRS